MTAPRRIHQYWSLLGIIYYVLDAACIVGGFLLATKWFAPVDVYDTMMWAAVAVAGYYLVAEAIGTYRDWHGSVAAREFGCVLLNWASTICGALLAAVLLGREDILPPSVAVAWIAATTGLLLAVRASLRGVLGALRARGVNTRNCAIVGVNELGFQLARNLRDGAGLGVRVCGFFDDRESERNPEIPADIQHQLGNVDDLLKLIQLGKVSTVYVTIPMRAEERIRSMLALLADTTASVYIVPDFFVFELLHSRWSNIGGLPTVSVFENPFYGVDGLAKRALDAALGAVLLVLLFPVMAAVAAAIKFTSRGPVFFRQERYGLDGRKFRVWKFRTMTVCESGDAAVQATKNDSRVTPLGAILRRTSIDELPQLFNVIIGDMSLVGPRPHASLHNEEYRRRIQGYMLRHKVRPGITGLAQVNGLRGETDTLDKMERRVACDHQYISNWSIWLDLQILFRTIWVVFKGDNAY